MTHKTPKITTLTPMVLPGNRRVSLEMIVENLPTTTANVLLMPDMFDSSQTGPPSKPDRSAPSPYPNVELSILNSQRQQVARLFIVEHKEPRTALTLHLRTPQPGGPYTARAEMTYNDNILDVVEAPFNLDE